MRLFAFFLVAAVVSLAFSAAQPALTRGNQPERVVSGEEQVLRSAGMSTDTEAILDYFRQRIQPQADLSQLVAIARQLGDAKEETRTKATAKLLAAGPWARPALRHVANELDDLLAAQQARRCLELVDGARAHEVAIAAAKLLGARKPAGASAVLLAFVPFADDQAVLNAVKNALIGIIAAPGKIDASVLAALNDRLPMRRALAVEVMDASGRHELLPDIRKLLADSKPQVRLQAALAMVRRSEEQAITVLIDVLADLPQDERRLAERALHDLAGEWSPIPAAQGEGKAADDSDVSRLVRREAWAGWWRAMNGPALLAAFRQRTLSKDDLARAMSLIEQLGDNSLAKRDQAVTELQAMGSAPTSLLREAAKSTDLERARRAEICLKHIAQNDDHGALPPAAPRLLALRKPAGSCEALLAYLPFTDDRSMKAEIAKALKVLVKSDGKIDQAVVSALSDSLPIRRIVALEALAGVGEIAEPALRKLLSDKNSEVRLRVALALVRAQDRDALPALIDVLGDLPRSQSWEVEDILRQLAHDKAPKATAGDDVLASAQLRDAWRAWWKEHGATVNLADLKNRTKSVLGVTVVAEIVTVPTIPNPNGGSPTQLPQSVTGADRLVGVDREGRVQWQIDNLQWPMDFQLLPDDRVLIAEYEGKKVTEHDLAGTILLQVKDLPSLPINVLRLPNGNTFIAMNTKPGLGGMLLEVDRAGKTVFTLSINEGNLSGGYKFPDGQMVWLLSNGLCVRLDANGKEIKRFTVPRLWSAIALMDGTYKGHILVVQTDNTLAEFDANGKIVWQVTVPGNGRPARLANGNTLYALAAGPVIELDPAGRTLWQYQLPAGYDSRRARQLGEMQPVFGRNK